MKRHKDAIAAQGGACNVVALSNALIAACREAREQGSQPETDPACRLIAHQIAFLMSTNELDRGGYSDAMTACETAAAA